MSQIIKLILKILSQIGTYINRQDVKEAGKDEKRAKDIEEELARVQKVLRARRNANRTAGTGGLRESKYNRDN